MANTPEASAEKLSSLPSKLVRQETEAKQIRHLTDTPQTQSQAKHSSRNHISPSSVPISKLPIELLAYIFEDFVELGQSPCLLTTINRRWRYIALATPVLWRHMFVCGNKAKQKLLNKYGADDMWTIDGTILVYNGMYMVCWTTEGVQFAVGRSAAAVLDIKYQTSFEPSHELLMFILTNYPSKIGSLSIFSLTYNWSQIPLHLPKLPALKQLFFRLFGGEISKQFVEALLISAPRLESVAMDMDDTLLPGHPVWSSLKELRLGKTLSCIEQLNGIVSQLTRLEVLKDCPAGWPNASTPHSILGHITSIIISCQPQYLSYVELPALQKLDWEALTESKNQEADPYLQSWNIAFSNLRYLRVKAPNVVWLSRMSFPNLRTFSWTKTALYPGPCPSFPNLQLESVETLICDAICEESVFLSALECTPNVHTVVFAPGTSMKCPEEWGKDLLSQISKHTPGNYVKLRHLTLRIGDHLVATNRAALKSTIQKIIKSRKSSGVPIQHFEVTWKHNRKVETVQYA